MKHLSSLLTSRSGKTLLIVFVLGLFFSLLFFSGCLFKKNSRVSSPVPFVSSPVARNFAAPPANPIAWWSFSEGSGTTTTDSIGSLAATFHSVPTWTTGISGSALTFDGVDDYLTTPQLNLGSQCSFSFWLNPSSLVDYRDPFGKLFQVSFTTYADGHIRFVLGNGTSWKTQIHSPAGSLPLNQWTFVTGTYDGTSTKLYLNGVLVGSASNPGLSINSTFEIGQKNGIFHQGMLDEIILYNRALTDGEILSYFEGSTEDSDSWWKLDDSGTLAADTAGDNPGILVNNPTWEAGKINGSLSFDGIDDYVSIADAASGSLDFSATDSFTIALWLKTTTKTGSPVIFSKGQLTNHPPYYLLSLDETTGKLRFQICDGTIENTPLEGSTDVADGIWHHVAIIRDATTHQLTIFVDGQQQGTVADTTTASLDTPEPLLLGQVNDTSNRWYTGSLDDIKIYHKALTPLEIIAIWNNVEGIVESFWSFEEGTGTETIDTITGQSATFHGTPTWTTGQVGGALEFDGIDDFITTPPINLEDHFSFTFWLNPTSLKDFGDPLGRFQYLSFTTYADGKLRYVLGNGSSWGNILYTDPGTLQVGQWTHITGTYDGTSTHLYVNGIHVGSASNPGYSLNQTFDIGQKNDYFFHGKIDEVHFFNRTLTEAEVQDEFTQDGGTIVVFNGTHWKLDDATGNAAADSLGGAAAVFSGNPTWTEGKINGALQFDGVDDYLITPTLQLGSNCSFSFWVNPDELYDFGDPFGKFANVSFSTYADGKIRFVLGNGSSWGTQIYSPVSTLQVGQWTHVTGTYDGSTTRLYIDGVLAGSANNPGYSISSDFTIGQKNNYFFKGKIDDVRTFNKTLTDTEVQELYGYQDDPDFTFSIIPSILTASTNFGVVFLQIHSQSNEEAFSEFTINYKTSDGTSGSTVNFSELYDDENSIAYLNWFSIDDLPYNAGTVELSVLQVNETSVSVSSNTVEVFIDNTSYANVAPVISGLVVTPVPNSDQVSIAFSLSDTENGLCSVDVMYGINENFTQFTTLTDISSGTHEILWNSSNDITSNQTVSVRLVPSDQFTSGSAVDSGLFFLTNEPQVNHPPVVEILEVNGDSGTIEIKFRLTDLENDFCTVEISFSASPKQTIKTLGIHPGEHIVYWDSLQDLQRDSANTKLYIVAIDQYGVSNEATFGPWLVLNEDPNLVRPAGNSLPYFASCGIVANTATKTIQIKAELRDNDYVSDKTQLCKVLYRCLTTEGHSLGGDLTNNTDIRPNWDGEGVRVMEISNPNRFSTCTVEIIPLDPFGAGVSKIVSQVIKMNVLPTAVHNYGSPQMTANGKVNISVDITDQDNDQCTGIFQYSTLTYPSNNPQSPDWQTVSLAGVEYVVSEPFDGKTSVSGVWNSRKDLPNFRGYVYIRVLSHDGYEVNNGYNTKAQIYINNTNTPPVIDVFTATLTDNPGEVKLDFTVSDAQDDEILVKISYEYVEDPDLPPVVTSAVRRAAGDGVVSGDVGVVSGLQSGESGSITWDSSTVIEGQKNVTFIAQPFDAEPGNPTAIQMSLDNTGNPPGIDTPPVIEIISAIPDLNTGIVNVIYKLTDAENDACTVSLTFDEDNKVANGLLGETTPDLTSGNEFSVKWHSIVDFSQPEVDAQAVAKTFKLVATENKDATKTGFATANLTLKNIFVAEQPKNSAGGIRNKIPREGSLWYTDQIVIKDGIHYGENYAFSGNVTINIEGTNITPKWKYIPPTGSTNFIKILTPNSKNVEFEAPDTILDDYEEGSLVCEFFYNHSDSETPIKLNRSVSIPVEIFKTHLDRDVYNKRSGNFLYGGKYGDCRSTYLKGTPESTAVILNCHRWAYHSIFGIYDYGSFRTNLLSYEEWDPLQEVEINNPTSPQSTATPPQPIPLDIAKGDVIVYYSSTMAYYKKTGFTRENIIHSQVYYGYDEISGQDNMAFSANNEPMSFPGYQRILNGNRISAQKNESHKICMSKAGVFANNLSYTQGYSDLLVKYPSLVNTLTPIIENERKQHPCFYRIYKNPYVPRKDK
jgi:hypothetical protein